MKCMLVNYSIEPVRFEQKKDKSEVTYKRTKLIGRQVDLVWDEDIYIIEKDNINEFIKALNELLGALIHLPIDKDLFIGKEEELMRLVKEYREDRKCLFLKKEMDDSLLKKQYLYFSGNSYFEMYQEYGRLL